MAELRSKQINSLTYRGQLLSGGMHVFRQSPWLGQGLHWFYLPQYVSSFGQPPNLEVGALASGGVVGLVAIVVLLVGLGLVLRRLPKPVGMLALCVLVGRVVQTQFDLFWVSAAGMLPFLIAGMALGVADRARSTLSCGALSGGSSALGGDLPASPVPPGP
jgi:O-antigen ligase